VKKCWCRFAKSGIDVDRLAAQLQDEAPSRCEIVERPDERDRIQSAARPALKSTRLDTWGFPMNVLVVDVAARVKILATGRTSR
jgi:hypothetical protein